MFQRPVCPFICPPTPTPQSLGERWGGPWPHAHPRCTLLTRWISLVALTHIPTPTWLQQRDHSFTGLFQLSEGGKPAPGHPWVPAPHPASCSSGQDWTEANSGAKNTVGSTALPPPATPPVYSRGNRGPEAKGQPMVPAPPHGTGLPSRPGVTRPTRGSCSAVTVSKFLIAFGARHPLVAIAAQPVPSLGTSSCCVWCAGGLPGFAFTGRQWSTPAHNAL